MPIQSQTNIIKQSPLPVQTTTTVIKQAPLPIQTTKTVIKSPPLINETQVFNKGVTLENIESTPDFNIDEFLKKNQSSTNVQQGRDSNILDEFFSSPQSFTNTRVDQVKIPTYTPQVPITMPEPKVPTTFVTGETFGEYKKYSNPKEFQTTFSPSFDLFDLNERLPKTIPSNLPETIRPYQGLSESIPLNLPETIPSNLPETIETIPRK